MGNCEAEENPAFRAIETSHIRNNTYESFNNINYINNLSDIKGNDNFITILNGQNSYKISRKKRFIKRKNIDKLNNNNKNKNNILIQDSSNTNSNTNNTPSKSKGGEMPENFLMLNANLDKFSRISTLDSIKSLSSKIIPKSKTLTKNIQNKNFENIMRNRNKIKPTINGETLNKIGLKKIGGKKMNNINNIYYNKDFNSNNEFEINFKCQKTIQGHIDKIVCATELGNRHLATGSYDKTIKIWNLNPCLNNYKTIKEEGNVLCILEFENNKLLSGTSKNNINLWNLLTLRLIFSFKGHNSWVNDLSKINNKYFASCSNDHSIHIWDYNKKICTNVLKGHTDCVLSLITLSGGELCSGGSDLSIKIWDYTSGKCCTTLLGHKKWIKCLCELTPNYIISGSDDRSIKLWSNNKCKYTFLGHERSVRTICRVDNNFFVSGSFDKTIRIWDYHNLYCVQIIYAHSDLILITLMISSGQLISCSNDHKIKIWKKFKI